MVLTIADVSDEPWVERVRRLYRGPECEPLAPGTETAIAISDAQFRADKEMLDEIHLMLRHLCAAIPTRTQ